MSENELNSKTLADIIWEDYDKLVAKFESETATELDERNLFRVALSTVETTLDLIRKIILKFIK